MIKLNSQKIISNIETAFLKTKIPNFKIGDNVKIGIKIIESNNKERIQFYEGIIISKKNFTINTTIIVRKIVEGIGVEKIFLIHAPKIKSIQILYSSQIRRSKLYFLRKSKKKTNYLKKIFLN